MNVRRNKKGQFVKGYSAFPDTQFKKGEKHPLYGKHRSRETREKISKAQKGKFRKPRVKRICVNCGKEFMVLQSEVKKSRKLGYEIRFCCRNCWREYNKTHPSSEKTRRQRIEALKKVKHTRDWNSKVALSKIGEKNPNWNNGSSFEPYPIGWTETLKEAIRKRDRYTCQMCGLHQSELQGRYKKLAVHHIDYNKNNLDPKNLITLCQSCHSKTNAKNREYWINFFKVLNGGKKK